MTLLLGLDLGTSYFKVGLFDVTGALRGMGRVAVQPANSVSGRSELPVDSFWQLLRRGLAEALQQAGAEARQITGLSYSSQANTFLLLDRHDVALTSLVLWTDRRREPLAESLVEFSPTPGFRHTVGFAGLFGGWAVAKLRWFQEKKPEISVTMLWSLAAQRFTLINIMADLIEPAYAGIFCHEPTRHIRLALH